MKSWPGTTISSCTKRGCSASRYLFRVAVELEDKEVMSLENPLSEFIADLEVREPGRAGGVTVYPLFNAGKVGPARSLPQRLARAS